MRTNLSTRLARAVAVCWLATTAACSAEIDASNAYDPASSEPARGALRGHLVAPGRPNAAGIEVRLEDGPEPVGSVTTDAEGAFTFGALKAGRYDLTVREVGYRELVRSRDVGIGETVELPPITLESLLGTEESSFVTGVATLEGRADHAGIVVRVPDTLFRTSTAEDGSFVLEVAEGTHTLAFSFPEYGPGAATVTVGKGETVALDAPVQLGAEPAVLSGTILGQDCRTATVAPIAGAIVSAGEGTATATTGPDGAFVLALTGGGTYTVVATADGFVSGRFDTVAIRGGASAALGERTLLPATGAFEGVARLADRVDHAGTIVQVTGELDRSTVTDGAGRYRIEQVCAGEGYEVRASPTASGFLPSVRAGLRIELGLTTTVEEMTLPVQRGGLVLNDRDPYTRAEGAPGAVAPACVDFCVRYTLDAVPGSTEMRFSEVRAALDGDTGWQPYEPLGELSLRPGEGLRTLFAQTRAGGAASTVFQASVIVDRTAPTSPELTIGSGAQLSNDPDGSVILELVASEAPAPGVDETSGLATVQLVDVDLQAAEAPPVDPLDPRWSALATPPILYRRSVEHAVLRPNDDEEKAIWVRFLDGAGNASSPIEARVTLDRAAPEAAGISVRTGTPGYTRSSVIELELSIQDAHPGVLVRVANGPDLTAAMWQPVPAPPTITWFLPQIEGLRAIHAQFRDAAGNLSAPVSTSIELDFTTVTGVRMTAVQAPFTNERLVDLDVAAQGAAEMRFSLRPDFTDAAGAREPWVSFATAWTIELPPEDGPSVIYGVFRDAAGNESVPLAANITLDTAPPDIAALALIEGAAVPSPDVTLSITALPGVSDAYEAQVAVTDVASGVRTAGAFVPFSPALPATLPAPPGDKLVELVLRDAAGNLSAPSTVAVKFDPDPPVLVGFDIDGAAAYTRSTDVTLRIDAIGAEQALVSNRGDFAGSVWQPLGDPQLAWTLPATDGPLTVHLRLRDAARNEIAGVAQIILDRTPPVSASVTIDGGSAGSNDSTVDLLLAAADGGSGLSYVELDTEASFAGAYVLPWAGAATQALPGFALDPGEGQKSVYARFVDVAGNATVTASSISVDTLAPAGSIAIDSGAGFTLDVEVSLVLSAPSDAIEVAIVDGALADCAAPRQPYAPTIPWTLPLGDGSKSVTLCFFDGAGNVATATDAIVLDSQSPAGTLQIAGDAAFTTTRDVTLTLTASADSAGMAIANDVAPDCAAATYEPFASTRAWQLTASDGARSVQLCLKDAAGRTALLTDAIVLDTIAPTASIELDAGGPFSVDGTVDVTLTAADATSGLASRQLRNDVAFAAAGVAFVASPQTVVGHALVGGDGARTVYARIADAAGNATIVSANVVVDSAVPVGTILIDGGAPWTQDRDVQLTLTAPADTTQLKIVDGAVASCAARVAYASTPTWTVPAGDGLKTISICFADAAGNTSTSTAQIILDTANPSGTLSIDAGASHSRDRDVVLALTSAADVVGIAFADGGAPTCASANYEAVVGQRSWQLPSTDGSKTVGVCFRDASGRTGTAIDTIVLDGTAPAPVTVSLAAGASYATVATVSVQISAADATAGLSTWELSLDPNFTDTIATAWPPGASVTVAGFPLAVTQGLQTVYTRVIDAAGNATVASDAITLDTQNPDGTVLINGGAAWVTSTGVTLTLSGPADTVSYKAVNGPVPSCAAPLSAYTASAPHSLAVGDGRQTVSVCFVDAAGRTATTSASTTLDTTSPVGTIAIEPAGAYTTSRTVNLRLAAEATQMALADGAAPNCASVTYEPYAPTKAWTLPVGDGNKIVGVCFRDDAGLTSSNTASIVLDGTPSPLAVSINAGATYDATGIVSIGLTFANDVAGYAVANGSLDCDTASYTVVPGGSTTATAVGHVLPAGDGTKTVVACVQDEAGNTSSGSDSIVLDQEAPIASSLELAGGAPYTIGALVLATLAGSGANEMCFYGDVSGASVDDCAVTGWGPFASQPALTLAGGDGDKVVYARLRDAAGNLSGDATAQIRRDASPPIPGTVTLSGVVADGVSTTDTRVQNVLVYLAGWTDASTPITHVQLSESPALAGAAWQPFGTDLAFTVSAGDGPKTVWVRVRDEAGNVSIAVSQTIALDTTAPENGVITLDLGATYSLDTIVDLHLYVSGDATRWSRDDGSTWTPCSPSPCASTPNGELSVLPLGAGEGPRFVTVVFGDDAGNKSTPVTASIIVDTQDPPVVTISGISVLTTAIYVDFADAPLGEGVSYYQVRALEPGKSEAAAVVVDVLGSEAWITDVPALIEYNVQVRTVDEAGRTSAWRPSNPQPVLVGLSTASIDGPTIGTLGQSRGLSWNGFVFSTGVENAASEAYELHVCDARRASCSTQGFTTTSRDPTPLTSGDQTAGSTLFAMRDELWMIGVRDRDATAGTDNGLDALWTRGPAGAVELAGWAFLELPAVALPGSEVTSLTATSNGRIAAIGYIQGTTAYVHTCRLQTGCRQSADWSAALAISSAALNPIEPGSKIALEAGENQLYATWAASNGASCTDASANCGVGLSVCTIAATATACQAGTDWARLRLNHPPGRPRGARAIEAEGRLFIASLFEPGGATGAPDGLFLWSCGVLQNPGVPQCTAAGLFDGPLLLQELASPAGGTTAGAPQLAFEYSNGSLFYATYDYNSRRANFGRCRANTDNCAGADLAGAPTDWNRSTLFDGDSYTAAPQLFLVGGNPVVVTQRGFGTLYLSEPQTWAPVRRALVPDLTTGGVRASWTDRTAPGIDGYRISYDATAPDGAGLNGTPFDLRANLFTPIGSSYDLVSTPGGEAQGTVTTARDLDQSIGEPVLRARGARRLLSTTSDLAPTLAYEDSNGQPRFAASAACYAIGFVDAGRNVKVAMCDRTQDCTLPASWTETTIEAYDPVGRDGDDVRDLVVALEPASARLHVAYSFGDTPYDLNYEFRTLGAGCAVSATNNQVELLDGSLADNTPGFLSLAATDARVFLAYSDDGSETAGPKPTALNTVLRGCDVGGCTNAANWSTVAFNHAYFGGALAVVGTDLVWAYAWNPDGAPDTAVTVDLLRCTLASRCDVAGDLLERHTVFALEGTFENGQGVQLRREEGRTLLSFGKSIAWCNGLQADCDSGDDWNRATLGLDLGTSSALPGGGVLPAPILPGGPNTGATPPELTLLGSVGNFYAGAIGELQAVAFDSTGIAIARCTGRCWNPDSWVLGMAQEGILARYAVVSSFSINGPIGDFTPAGFVLVTREYDDPTATHRWVFHTGGEIDLQ